MASVRILDCMRLPCSIQLKPGQAGHIEVKIMETRSHLGEKNTLVLQANTVDDEHGTEPRAQRQRATTV
jgi:hypothetical protein